MNPLILIALALPPIVLGLRAVFHWVLYPNRERAGDCLIRGVEAFASANKALAESEEGKLSERELEVLKLVQEAPPRKAVGSISSLARPRPAISIRRMAQAADRSVSVSGWPMRLLGAERERYQREWGAHLLQLVEDGEIEQARAHRRQFRRQAVLLAIAIRTRRALGRAR
jgi:hypothetical protein